MEKPDEIAKSYFSDRTLDDVMRSVFLEIQSHGDRIKPEKGDASELRGVLIEIKNPRARLSRTETRGKLYSCLGELCWYLARTKDPDFISYYIKVYGDLAEGNEIYGGYGPRLFCWKGQNQIANVSTVLRNRRDSRRAVIQLFDAVDIAKEHKDIPCTCTLQFMIRHDKLHMFTAMRSNDAFLGLPHDVFSFTMLQEIMARTLTVDLGSYKHAVGSLHLYDCDKDAVKQFLGEGFQETDKPMPPMPKGDPWPSISSLLKAESALRTEGNLAAEEPNSIDPYWADLIRLLQVFRCGKDGKPEKIRELREKMSSDIYRPFIDARLS